MPERETELRNQVNSLLHENATLLRRIAQLESQATQDSLTGLPNRRACDERLPEFFSASRRHGTDLSVLMIDIDGLKAINDALGHAAGDELIRLAASTIRTTIRRSDFAARLGGDEFAVLLPHSSLGAASRLAERITDAFASATETLQRRLEASRLRVHIRAGGKRAGETAEDPRQQISRIGLSIGIAAMEQDSIQSGKELLARADRALYAAKHAGKCCVRIAKQQATLNAAA